MKKTFASLVLAIVLLIPAAAHAACTSPAGSAGNIFYNSDFSTYQFCNGTAWIAFGGGGAGGGLWTAGTGDDIYYNSGTPQVGIGTVSPAAMLDVTGEIKFSSAGLACAASTEGAQRYDTAIQAMQVCDGTAWTALGGGLWTDNTSYITRGSAHIINDATALPAGLTGAGTRMLWYPNKNAFRAGSVTGTQWDDVNIGTNSVAMGRITTASGAESTAMGAWTTASGVESTAMGRFTTASGAESTAMGNWATASGTISTAMGSSVVAGDGVAGSGFGDGSIAMGLIHDQVTITTRPQVTGIQSYGIFMGDQDGGIVLASSNTMGLFGGRMVIDPAVPATQLAVSGGLELDVEGDIGAIKYCDEQGNNCYTTTQLLNGTPAGADTQIQFNKVGAFGANANFVLTSTGNVGIGTASPTAGSKLDVNGVVNLGGGGDISSSAAGTGQLRIFGNGYTGYIALNGAGMSIGHNAGSRWLGFDVNETQRLRIDSLGKVTGTFGNYHVSSDRRLKKDITTISGALDKVMRLRGVNFRWKDDDSNDKGRYEDGLMIGFISQEVEEIVPEVVHTSDDEMGTKAVEYEFMTALLAEATKELKVEKDSEVQALQVQIDGLIETNENLLNEVKGLKAHTGYGVNKAEIGIWMLMAVFGTSSVFFLIGGVLRARQRKAQ